MYNRTRHVCPGISLHVYLLHIGLCILGLGDLLLDLRLSVRLDSHPCQVNVYFLVVGPLCLRVGG